MKKNKIIDKTEEEQGRGFQILAMKSSSKQSKKISLKDALINDSKGIDKPINVVFNSLAIISFFIILFAMIFIFGTPIYKIIISIF